MDVKYILPFLESLKNVLEQFGVTDIKRGGIRKKETMHIDMDVTSFLGLVGAVRGNIAYSMTQDTAKKIVSAMMMGMPVEKMDEIARSALAELSNMVTGSAASMLSGTGAVVDVTPPSIIFGSNIYFILSSVETLSIDMETSMGKIEVGISLEC